MQAAVQKDVREIGEASVRFAHRLDALKQAHGSAAFAWYPYSTFAIFPILDSLLRNKHRDLGALAGPSPVLDIGCGDGGLSFFLESEGFAVRALDHPKNNHNRTLGFQTLRTALASSVELQLCDLDTGLDLREHTFGLALCLGVLYHLRNPFGFLETLARHARYCVLSTRIAQVTAAGRPIADEPVAYLLDTAESNNDESNFWIFSEAGLRRILARCGWDVCDYLTGGCRKGSDPVRGDRDERAYCLIRSRLPDPWVEVDLAGGWHDMEAGSWRWTGRVFSVLAHRPASSEPTLRLRFVLPEAVLRVTGPIGLQAEIDGHRLPACEYNSAGEHVYTSVAPLAASHGDQVRVRFELDKALPPSESDRRELGVQVVFWTRDEPVPRSLAPITLDK